MGKVTARIPWPNPLTSSVGLSLESLHLTFYLEPTLTPRSDNPLADSLAESVASIAETFIHEELTPNEEATLRESIHPDSDHSTSSTFDDHVPGGLDPFISEEEVHLNEADPPGVSIFATLIERLLARFQFDATDTRITIVNPSHASFTLIVPEIRYGTETPDTPSRPADPPSSPSMETLSVGETRKVTITGVTMTTRCLRPQSPQPLIPYSPPIGQLTPRTASPTTPMSALSQPETHARTLSPGPPSPDTHSTHSSEETQHFPASEPSSPYSDSSDLDEDTQLFMSQSIAVLPPRPVSPASSVASSMYQSAISINETDARLDDIPEEEGSRSHTVTPSGEGHERPPPSPPYVESDIPQHPVVASLVEAASGFRVSRAHSPVQCRLTVRSLDIEDETILSLGSEPIELRLRTLPPSRPAPVPRPAPSGTPSSFLPEAPPARTKSQYRQDKVHIELSIGQVAFALNARQIRSIIDIAELWTSHSAPVTASTQSRQPEGAGIPLPFDDIEGAARIRGIVILLLPSIRSSAANPDDALTEYFTRPLVPPHLPRGYTRIHIEGISSSLLMKRPELPKGRGITPRREPPSVSASFTIVESSAFAFLPQTGPNGEMTASPILITDPHLTSQYPVAHQHSFMLPTSEPSSSLPTFDVADWTDPTQRSVSAKLSLWRTKAAQYPLAARSPSSPTHHNVRLSSPGPTSPPKRGVDLPGPSSLPSTRTIPVALPSSPGRLVLAGLSSSPGKGVQMPSRPPMPAVSVKFRSARPKDGRNVPEVHVALAPLHIFLDIGMLLSRQEDGKSEAIQFIEELTAAPSCQKPGEPGETPQEGHVFEDVHEEERPRTPRASGLRGLPDRETDQERERQRLEQLVLEDLDLGYDYREHRPARAQITPTSRRSAVSWIPSCQTTY